MKQGRRKWSRGTDHNHLVEIIPEWREMVMLVVHFFSALIAAEALLLEFNLSNAELGFLSCFSVTTIPTTGGLKGYNLCLKIIGDRPGRILEGFP